MSAPVKVLARITIGSLGEITVRAVDAVEGGGYGLTVEKADGMVTWVEIHRGRDGTWRTEDLEAVGAYSPAVGTEDGEEDETAAPAAEPEPARETQLDLFGGGTT